MATPTTKATFKQYCLRALGQPVIEINVDDDQCDDRVEEALQYFQEHVNFQHRLMPDFVASQLPYWGLLMDPVHLFHLTFL